MPLQLHSSSLETGCFFKIKVDPNNKINTSVTYWIFKNFAIIPNGTINLLDLGRRSLLLRVFTFCICPVKHIFTLLPVQTCVTPTQCSVLSHGYYSKVRCTGHLGLSHMIHSMCHCSTPGVTYTLVLPMWIESLL